MTRVAVLPELDAASYRRHALHAEDRIWIEKNCYVDIWIEVLHALGVDPMAMLPFTIAVDFVDDQWTFFKPPHGELHELYGLDVQELNVWRPLLDHALEHLAAGRLISTEADAYWLPDTSGTDYRSQHTKTTIVIQDIDVERRRLGYFHNASYHQLEGEDFVHTFGLDLPRAHGFMPLFAETIRSDRRVARPPRELQERSRALLRSHLGRRPTDNPVVRFGERFAKDLSWIQDEGLAFYHAWAFATVRQFGAAFELAAMHARWLDDARLIPAAEAFEALSSQAKAFILKAARVVNGKRAFDASAQFAEMAAAYQQGMHVLDTEIGRQDG
jgi:hypothetical protein